MSPRSASRAIELSSSTARSARGRRRAERGAGTVTRTLALRASAAGSCSRCRPRRSDSNWHASTPATVFPRASSGGLKSPIPNCPGLTASSPPDTPLLAGSPTRSIQSPAASYIPHIAIIESTWRAVSSRTTTSPVTGLRPPWASVRRHHRQVAGGDQHRALTEVRVDRLVDTGAQRARGAHQVRHRAVAVAGRALGREDGLVDGERAAGERLQDGEDAREAADERGGQDRARVDQRVGGPARARLEADGVERLAAGLGPDALLDRVEAHVLQRQRVDEGLGDRLDRQRRLGVAGAVDVAVEAGEREPEPRRIGARELRDVVGQRHLRRPPARTRRGCPPRRARSSPRAALSRARGRARLTRGA